MSSGLHLYGAIQEQLGQLTETMLAWEAQTTVGEDELAALRSRLHTFDHTVTRKHLFLGGAHGSGDFPTISYADAFVYVTGGRGVIYAADRLSGLREIGPEPDPVVHFTWAPDDAIERTRAFKRTFAALAGLPIHEVVERSDYRHLKPGTGGRRGKIEYLVENLIIPHAADAANIGIQLRTTGELGAALQLIRRDGELAYVLVDGTFALPFIDRPDVSLFYEHLKRLCCVEARARGCGFFAVSAAHGLPGMDVIERLARENAGLERGSVAEHWYVRLPMPGRDEWEMPYLQGRRLPPPGAVTYLLRFHRTMPVMRLDMDLAYWQEQVRACDEEEMRANERRIFADLDYASHDQRCYGYPYPLRTSRDRATLSGPERTALRRQIVDTAVRAGMKRSLFREARISETR